MAIRQSSQAVPALAGLSDLTPDSTHREELIRLRSLAADRKLFIDSARREGVASLLYKNLMASGLLESLSNGQREKLRSFYYQTLSLNLRFLHDLKHLLEAANHKGIPVVLLQGIVLLEQLYRDIGLRPLSDIDIWVLEEDYLPFIDTLEALGYKRDLLYPNTLRKGLTVLDLHTHILGADRIRARTLLFPKEQKVIFNHTQLMDFGGSKARCLNKYDQVLYLCLHALKHNLERLIWLVDIKGLLTGWDDSDWEACRRRARELDQRKTLSYILFILTRLFDLQIPLEAREFMEEARLNCIEMHLLRKRVRGNPLPIWAPLVLFSPEKGMWKRVIFTLETLFPRPDILRQVFEGSPDPTAWHLYGMRVVQLVRMAKTSFTATFFHD